VKLAKDTGIDIFRIFDCLNNVDNLEVGIRAVHAAGGVVEGAIMYTGDMLKPGKYDLKYYMGIVDKLVDFGSHLIAIKSMSGVMKPSAGRVLVRAIRAKYPHMPIHMHTHDTNGAGIATMLACAEEGADIVDTAIDSLSGATSQPAVSAMLGALEGTGFDAELDLDHIEVVDTYWAQLRLMYAGFDADLRSPDPSIYRHEIPGGQLSNLMFQARQIGLGSQWLETKQAYTEANHLLGDIIKATPTSKAVGDLAQFMVDRKMSAADVLQHASTLDFPASVLEYFEGLMGQPFDGFPEPFRTDALRGRRRKLSCRPGLIMAPVDFGDIRQQILRRCPGVSLTEHDVASYIMYPDVYLDFRKARDEFGDLTELPTPIFLTCAEIGQEISVKIEDGKELVVKMIAIGAVEKDTAKREVLFQLNGELRSVHIQDSKGKPAAPWPHGRLSDLR
jgi:pyruvate carboxylase